jgi:hypothetical protein
MAMLSFSLLLLFASFLEITTPPSEPIFFRAGMLCMA